MKHNRCHHAKPVPIPPPFRRRPPISLLLLLLYSPPSPGRHDTRRVARHGQSEDKAQPGEGEESSHLGEREARWVFGGKELGGILHLPHNHGECGRAEDGDGEDEGDEGLEFLEVAADIWV